MTSNARQARKIRQQIATLIRTAETGEQWAEICRLEAIAIALETV